MSNRFQVAGITCGVQSCDSTEANVFFNESSGVTTYARLVDGKFEFKPSTLAAAKAFFIEHKAAFLRKIAELVV